MILSCVLNVLSCQYVSILFSRDHFVAMCICVRQYLFEGENIPINSLFSCQINSILNICWPIFIELLSDDRILFFSLFSASVFFFLLLSPLFICSISYCIIVYLGFVVFSFVLSKKLYTIYIYNLKYDILVQKIINGIIYKKNVHLHFQTIARVCFQNV